MAQKGNTATHRVRNQAAHFSLQVAQKKLILIPKICSTFCDWIVY